LLGNSDRSSLTWDWGKRPIKNLLYELGCNYGLAFCRKKGLPQEKELDVQEWLLDLVWIDKATMAIRLAVESEFASSMPGRLDDFEKLMSIKSPLKLFIYATRNLNESDEVREKLADYLLRFSQHLEGEEYLLMEVMKGRPGFYHYLVPNSGSVSDVAFTPLQLGLSFSA
jgi:hypothetical protein